MVYYVPHYIDAEAVHLSSPYSHKISNPALGEQIGQVFFADHKICEQAAVAAATAWPAWAATPPGKRATILFKFRDLLIKNQLAIARLVTSEHGKTLADAEGSISRAIEVVEFHCALVTELQGSFSVEVSSNVDCYTMRQPIGICAGVSPFNFPVMVPIWMMIPAIACGNTFILKPSEQNPSATLRLFELLTEAGLPAGVANCVQGDQSTVQHLLAHPKISAFTAVASTPVAESIYTSAVTNGKRAHTFGSAKNHCLVMPDADLEYAARAIVGAAFGSAGERCMAISVVVTIDEQTATQMTKLLIPLIKDIRVDAGDAENADMGPLISERHRLSVLKAIEAGIAEGAELIMDGREFKHKKYSQGYYLGPCLFSNVTENMSIYQQEIFGPVLVMIKANNFAEALALINRHQYGNGTAIFTRDGFCGREFSKRVQAGLVGINIPIPVPIASHPFGGWKRSFFGDTNMHGVESINFYTHRKTVTCKWPITTFNDSSFAMPSHK